ncbi:MAG: rhodanese-like domain-containing protein [Melioribacteraceae bacterium]
MNILSSFLSKTKDLLDLDNSEFKNLAKQENVIVLDVRTKEENFEKRIPNSILIDIYEPDFSGKIEKLERDKTYLVYCRSGVRSKNACNFMKQAGFENVYNLKGGIIGWSGKSEQG